MLEVKPATGIAEGEGFVARAIVGHDTLDGDTEACIVGNGGLEEGDGASFAFVGLDMGEGVARGIVNADIDKRPADAAGIALTGPITVDAMADAVELTELFDVDVDQRARPRTLIAATRVGGRQGAQSAEAQPLEDAAQRGGRDTDFGGDRLAGQALATQAFNTVDDRLRRRSMQPLRPRAAIVQAAQAFGGVAVDPFAHRARANADGFTDGLRRLPTENHFDHTLSTERGQAGILMDVHSALPPRLVEVSTNPASSVGAEWTTYLKLPARELATVAVHAARAPCP